ncbi:MAG: YgiT-type zinc finger protein [Elusimicrobia bacterium]|nr:YgiT-type zinc finger protein [Elusimicrobiota bacterium]
MQRKRTTLDRLIKGRVYLFEEVPVLACLQCGEIWIPGKTAEWMENVLQGHAKPTKEVTVPVYSAAA